MTNRGSDNKISSVETDRYTSSTVREGYISNPYDESMINDQLHRQVVEQAIVDGLKQYFSS